MARSRGGRIPGVFDRRATQPGGMHRRSQRYRILCYRPLGTRTSGGCERWSAPSPSRSRGVTDRHDAGSVRLEKRPCLLPCSRLDYSTHPRTSRIKLQRGLGRAASRPRIQCSNKRSRYPPAMANSSQLSRNCANSSFPRATIAHRRLEQRSNQHHAEIRMEQSPGGSGFRGPQHRVDRNQSWYSRSVSSRAGGGLM